MVEVVGIYPVPEAPSPCHLIEVIVRDSPGFDVGDFRQETPGEPPDNWQTAWDECVLSANGDAVVANAADGPLDADLLTGTVRLAFFLHYFDPRRSLLTPFEEIAVPQPTERPARLRMIKYEEP